VRRFLDVLFQHLRWLVVLVLAVPSVLGAGALGLDGSRVVTARIEVDPASFVAAAVSDVFPVTQAPSQAAAALIGQLVQTDWFTGRLLTGPGAAPLALRSAAERAAVAADLRAHLQATAEGTSLVSLQYTTDRPGRGVVLVGLLLGALGDAVQTVEAQRASAALQAATGQLAGARAAMERSTDEVNRYAYMADQTGDALQPDPTYRGLVAAAQAATDHYQQLSTLTDQAQAVSAAVPHVHGQVAVVVDPPAPEPSTRVTMATRVWLVGLAGTSAIGLLVVYLVALHDPRLRSPADLRGRLPAACLLSIPPAAPRSPS
jgi:hypothetical protein